VHRPPAIPRKDRIPSETVGPNRSAAAKPRIALEPPVEKIRIAGRKGMSSWTVN
jgi:hypothetical protein